MLQPDTVLNQRYRLQERIGEGGMATVYRAVDARLGRTVAVKVLHTQFARDEPFLQRFQQEAEFAASLGSHPNIVAIFDIGHDEPYHYIVMELVEGRSLKDLIEERAPFSVGEAFAIGQQVALALDFAHKRGLVHRDVKPQNILVTPEGSAKVTDFGIARSLSASQLTRTGMVVGTVHYFSPEQAQGKPAGPASDIYSLGIILYEMLTGHLPFDGENPIGIAMQHVHSDPPPPWEYNPNLPTRAATTVMRALEKDPEMRYRDANEFASALGQGSEADVGATTIFSPVPPAPQRTSVYRSVEPIPGRTEHVRRERTVVPARPAAAPAPNRWKTAWLAVGAVLLALAVGLGAFLTTSHVLGGGAASTPTPTSSPTPKPKPRKPTPTPSLQFSVVPTSTPAPVFVPPAATPTSPPPPTPVPPTPTPRPVPRPPTSTPLPADTPTPRPVGPTETPTPFG